MALHTHPLKTSFRYLLEQVLPHLSEHLLPSPELLTTATHQMPPSVYGMLELRLETGATQVDICQGFRPDQFAFLQEALDSNGWRNSAHLVGRLRSIQASKAVSVQGIGLEYDLELTKSRLAPPSLFFLTADGAEVGADLWPSLLAEVHGDAAANALRELLGQLPALLPSNSTLKDAGLMLSRTGQALRLQLKDVPPEGLKSVARQLGVAVSESALGRAAGLCHKLGLGTVLCLDFTSHLQPVMGIELYANEKGKTDLLRALSVLVEQQLCCSQKARALLAWPGRDYPQTPAPDWLKYLGNAPPSDQERQALAITRHIAHLKLRLAAEDAIEAKAYLEFYPEVQVLGKFKPVE